MKISQLTSLRRERLSPLPVRSGLRQRCPLSPPDSVVAEAPAEAIERETVSRLEGKE